MEEIFIILSGTVKITIGNETDTLSKGDTVVIPEKHDHLMKNTGRSEVEYIVISIIREQGGKTIVTNQ